MSSNKLIAGVIGVGAIAAAGVGLYYLLQDDEIEVEYDPKIHNKELLLSLFQEFEVEYASLYLHWHSMLKAKEKEVGKGKIDKFALEKFEEQVRQLTEQVDEEIFGQNKLNSQVFDKMLEANKDDAAVKKFQDNMEKNYSKLMNVERPEFHFEFPKELTKEDYLKYLKLSYAKFRYEIYHEVQKVMRETGQQRITKEQFDGAIKKVSLPSVKEQAYKKLNFPEVPGEKTGKTALKAYLVHMQNDEIWSSEILSLQKSHKEILFQIPEGRRIEGMHEDPLEVFDREREYEKQFDKKKSATDATHATIESQKSLDMSAESKKGNGSFSFLGSQKDQQKLVQEFLNRNKKTDEIKEVAEEDNQDDKPEEEQKKAPEETKEEKSKEAQEPETVEKPKSEVEEDSPKVEDEDEDDNKEDASPEDDNKEDASPEDENEADNEEDS
eukprot:CAMPEP_0196994972 /NCGR_PEP_ID=MMETSP1380-20130617/1184_1 /TAXON_ID=5936 /ORGANISM="Euplotes crassus, Strain CT5" /LENGTH=438 /DNA_ID=CAMNT_0042410499 /DNA_START=1 /DNA_END=1317 /DNA_ORIENTATION=+